MHPILKDLRSLLVYTLVWLLISAADLIIIYFNYKLPLGDLIINSLVFNLLFAFMGLAIWYAVVYSFPDEISVLNLIVNHVSAAAIIVLIWIFSGLFLVNIFTTEATYNFISAHIFWYIFIGVTYYAIFILIYYLIIYNRNLKEKKKNEDKLIAMVKEAELNLLKSQINPHFLFNSLNSISSLTITNPGKAHEMIIKLSDFLRYSISRHSTSKASLKVELENIQRYLDIEKTRFGKRLEYEHSFPEETLEKTLPVMILQPLFENAIKHGVYESTEPVIVRTSAFIENEMLIINISNNFDPDAPTRKGAGIGLKNIRERLRLIYLQEGLLKTTRTANTFEVRLMIPQKEE